MDVLPGTMYQSPKFCLKDLAWWNIELMSSTDETFQLEMSLLNEAALRNILNMLVTDETSQEEMSPLKESAL